MAQFAPITIGPSAFSISCNPSRLVVARRYSESRDVNAVRPPSTPLNAERAHRQRSARRVVQELPACRCRSPARAQRIVAVKGARRLIAPRHQSRCDRCWSRSTPNFREGLQSASAPAQWAPDGARNPSTEPGRGRGRLLGAVSCTAPPRQSDATLSSTRGRSTCRRPSDLPRLEPTHLVQPLSTRRRGFSTVRSTTEPLRTSASLPPVWSPISGT